MEDFNNGTITAAEALQKISNVSTQAINLADTNNKAISENTKNKVTGGNLVTGGFMGGIRNAASALSLGYVENVSSRNNRIDTENAAMAKEGTSALTKSFEMSKPLMNATMREDLIFNGGQGVQDKLGEFSSEKLRARASSTRLEAQKEDIAGNTESANALRERAAMLDRQADENIKSLANLQKEIDRNRAAFEAMNIGLSNVNAAANASVLGINNLVNSLEAGFSPMENALSTLESGISSAAQGISDADFSAALGQASDALRKFGATKKQTDQFEGNVKAINSVQKNSANIFEQVKTTLSASGKQDADTRKTAVIKAIMDSSGIDANAPEFKALRDSLEGASIDLEKLASGDITVFEEALKDLGENAIKQAKDAFLAEIQITKQLVALTKNRIDAERNLAEATKEAASLMMEGREIQAKYGGRPVGMGEKRNNILETANASNKVSGLSALGGTSAQELRARTNEIRDKFTDIENKRAKGELSGVKGAELGEQQKDLKNAQKEQVATIRSLIKLEEENLKLIQEKNKLEKDSLQSLIGGDIEKFFQQQAAAGATAAIATGNKSLMSGFGAEALGGAFANIDRQKEAGVDSLYGRKITGQGGLSETAAGAALQARGVTNPAMMQTLAGTTPEEEAARARLRGLGGELGAAGQTAVDMASMEVTTAEITIQQATIKSESGIGVVQERERLAREQQNRATGGLIYANNGMFIPRGTDTVPAMLTPGEFVVRREAVNRGNNLQLLRSINGGAGGGVNGGFARGGKVQYLYNGSNNAVSQEAGGGGGFSDPEVINRLANALSTFNTGLSASIDKLVGYKFTMQLDTTNINVNLSGGSFIQKMSEDLKADLYAHVGNEIIKYKAGEGGVLRKEGSITPTR